MLDGSFRGLSYKRARILLYTDPFGFSYQVGDSAIKVLSIQRLHDKQFRDSLHNSIDDISDYSSKAMQGYKVQLNEKEVRRILRKDSIVWIRKYDTIVTNIEVFQYDTIHRDTIVYRSIFKRKLF